MEDAVEGWPLDYNFRQPTVKKVNNKLLAVHHDKVTLSSTIWAYDTKLLRWTQYIGDPLPLQYGQEFTVIDGSAYFCGGFGREEFLWKFSVPADEHVLKSQFEVLPVRVAAPGRRGHVVTSYSNKIYLFGGQIQAPVSETFGLFLPSHPSNGYGYTNELWECDLDDPNFVPVKTSGLPPGPNFEYRSVTVGCRMFVLVLCGGFAVHEMNLRTRTWQTICFRVSLPSLSSLVFTPFNEDMMILVTHMNKMYGFMANLDTKMMVPLNFMNAAPFFEVRRLYMMYEARPGEAVVLGQFLGPFKPKNLSYSQASVVHLLPDPPTLQHRAEKEVEKKLQAEEDAGNDTKEDRKRIPPALEKKKAKNIVWSNVPYWH